MDIKTIGRWAYLVGLVLAIVTALVGYSADWLSIVILVLAIVTGVFYLDTKELTNYGVRYLVLAIVAGALNAFPLVGPYVTDIANAMVAFFGPIILTVLLVFNFNQAVAWFKGD
jgi:4-hydroxybenzoate polyprenyltransferase